MRLLLPTARDDVDPVELYDAGDRRPPEGRPWVLANMVSTVDGAGAFGGVTAPISSPTDKRLFALLRSVADLILVGASTVRAEGYGPAKLSEALREKRTARGQEPVPPIAVVSGSLQLDWSSRFFGEAGVRPIVLTMASAPEDARARAAEVADVVVAGDDRVDIADAMAQLRDRGFEIVLTEGGPTLLGELVAADLLDELCLALSPMIAAGRAPRIVGSVVVEHPQRLAVAHVLEDDGFLFLRYVRPG